MWELDLEKGWERWRERSWKHEESTAWLKKKGERRKWSIEVYDCLFHLWGWQGLFEGHWRDNLTHTHTHTRTHTRCPESIWGLIFSLKDIPRLGMGWKFICCFSTWMTSFSPALPPTVDKRETPTKPIKHLSSVWTGRSCGISPSFSPCTLFSVCDFKSVCVCVCLCACVRACAPVRAC